MNKDRRQQLSDLIRQINDLPDLSEIQNDLESIRDDEQESFDNLPESLQQADRGQAMEAAIAHIQEAIDMLDGFNTTELVGHLEEASE